MRSKSNFSDSVTLSIELQHISTAFLPSPVFLLLIVWKLVSLQSLCNVWESIKEHRVDINVCLTPQEYNKPTFTRTHKQDSAAHLYLIFKNMLSSCLIILYSTHSSLRKHKKVLHIEMWSLSPVFLNCWDILCWDNLNWTGLVVNSDCNVELIVIFSRFSALFCPHLYLTAFWRTWMS